MFQSMLLKLVQDPASLLSVKCSLSKRSATVEADRALSHFQMYYQLRNSNCLRPFTGTILVTREKSSDLVNDTLYRRYTHQTNGTFVLLRRLRDPRESFISRIERSEPFPKCSVEFSSFVIRHVLGCLP